MTETDIRAACPIPVTPDENGNDLRLPTRLCVIDLGTNSFHAVIVDAYPNGTFEVLDRMKEMVQLGKRGLVEHRLTEVGMDRAVTALKRIRLLADGWETTEYLAYATSAVREAENGGDLILRVRKELGLNIEPISGELEASLIFRGVRRAVDLHEPTFILDIGGGSVECIVAQGDEVYYQDSLKIGAARMTERFVSTDPISKDEFRPLRNYLRSFLQSAIAAAREHRVRDLVGTSGTMENITEVTAHAGGKKGRSVFERTFEASEIRSTTKRIMESSREERRRMKGIDAKRVDQVPAGAMLADIVLKDLGIERVRISPYALREGIVVYFIENNYRRLGRIAPYRSVRRRSIYEIAYRFRWDERHAGHVTAMALQLFDACRSLHGLNGTARELLEFAALLHDIGYHISPSSHHKHSRYLIRNADLRGFAPDEIETMAQVARYHRGRLPRKKHHSFQRLPEAQRTLISQLGAFLRLANGLDRSHFQNVRSLQTELSDARLRLMLNTTSDPQLDVWGATRGSDFFEATFDRKVVIEAEEEQS